MEKTKDASTKDMKRAVKKPFVTGGRLATKENVKPLQTSRANLKTTILGNQALSNSKTNLSKKPATKPSVPKEPMRESMKPAAQNCDTQGANSDAVVVDLKKEPIGTSEPAVSAKDVKFYFESVMTAISAQNAQREQQGGKLSTLLSIVEDQGDKLTRMESKIADLTEQLQKKELLEKMLEENNSILAGLAYNIQTMQEKEAKVLDILQKSEKPSENVDEINSLTLGYVDGNIMKILAKEEENQVKLSNMNDNIMAIKEQEAKVMSMLQSQISPQQNVEGSSSDLLLSSIDENIKKIKEREEEVIHLLQNKVASSEMVEGVADAVAALDISEQTAMDESNKKKDGVETILKVSLETKAEVVGILERVTALVERVTNFVEKKEDRTQNEQNQFNQVTDALESTSSLCSQVVETVENMSSLAEEVKCYLKTIQSQNAENAAKEGAEKSIKESKMENDISEKMDAVLKKSLETNNQVKSILCRANALCDNHAEFNQVEAVKDQINRFRYSLEGMILNIAPPQYQSGNW